MARFYGFSHNEIEQMSFDDFASYLRCIRILKGRETLEALQIATYPKASKRDQEKIKRAALKDANPSLFDKPKTVVTLKDLARMAGISNE